MCRHFARIAAISCLVVAPRLTAQRDSSRSYTADSTARRSLASVRVTGRSDDLFGTAASAAQGRIGARDLRLRPLRREGELLEAVPGMIVTQHSGDGKANQFFVRGFNLDHGTDFQTRLEGMPINNPSHAHGQGYTDLNFIIPEFVDYIDYRLGVHHASMGDFGSAGGAEFHLVNAVDRPFVSTEAGRFGFGRLVGGGSSKVGAGTLLIGGEMKGYDGPWSIDQNLRKRSGIARYTRGAPTSQWSLLALGYANRWNASDQVPLRAVAGGALSPFAQVDPTLGGASYRYSLSGSYQHVGATSLDRVQLYVVRSSVNLYSNFTYLLKNAALGDQFNQREKRTVLGVDASHKQAHTFLGRASTTTLGVQSRVDAVRDVGLYRTQRRRRLGAIRVDDITEVATGFYTESETQWSARVRSVIGLRGDVYRFDVRSDNRANSGTHTEGIASPKASLIFAPTRNLEVYIGGGLGFHSNDARGTTITRDPVTHDTAVRVDPLVRSRGAEFGLRGAPVRGLRSTLSVWALGLDSELLFVGDGGTTEPSDKSARAGITLANFYRPFPELSFDADVSFAKARFTGVAKGAEFIPGALERVLAAGVAYGGVAGGAFAAARVRYFGSYPLTEDNIVRATASTLVNAEIGWQLPNARLALSVLNLFNNKGHDIQYFYASRLANEPVDGVEDVHVHPMEPRQLRISVRIEP